MPPTASQLNELWEGELFPIAFPEKSVKNSDWSRLSYDPSRWPGDAAVMVGTSSAAGK